MDTQLIIIILLTMVIHIVGTLAYSCRIAGTRTGRVAVSLSMFNILNLISRTSNTFQAPLIAKRVENRISSSLMSGGEVDFRLILLAASVATILGALLIPSFQRIFSKGVNSFSKQRSILKLIFRCFSPSGIAILRDSVTFPTLKNFSQIFTKSKIELRVILINVVVVAIWTTGVLSSLYAEYLTPEYRSTASQLSGIINGLSTILMFIFIDPYVSILTDDVASGRLSEPFFRRSIVWLVFSRLCGTLLAQIMLVPAAMLIAFVAKHL